MNPPRAERNGDLHENEERAPIAACDGARPVRTNLLLTNPGVTARRVRRSPAQRRHTWRYARRDDQRLARARDDRAGDRLPGPSGGGGRRRCTDAADARRASGDLDRGPGARRSRGAGQCLGDLVRSLSPGDARPDSLLSRPPRRRPPAPARVGGRRGESRRGRPGARRGGAAGRYPLLHQARGRHEVHQRSRPPLERRAAGVVSVRRARPEAPHLELALSPITRSSSARRSAEQGTHQTTPKTGRRRP